MTSADIQVQSSTVIIEQIITVVPVPAQPLIALSVLVDALRSLNHDSRHPMTARSAGDSAFTIQTTMTPPSSLSVNTGNQTTGVSQSITDSATATTTTTGASQILSTDVRSSLVTVKGSPSPTVTRQNQAKGDLIS